MAELTVIDCAQPPPPTGEGTQLVSLPAELSMLEDALTAAAQAPIAIDSVLVLVTARMTHLRRVLSCEADPLELLAPHNSVHENEFDVPDVVRLRPWTAAERVIHLGRLLARAEAKANRDGPMPPGK